MKRYMLVAATLAALVIAATLLKMVVAQQTELTSLSTPTPERYEQNVYKVRQKIALLSGNSLDYAREIATLKPNYHILEPLGPELDCCTWYDKDKTLAISVCHVRVATTGQTGWVFEQALERTIVEKKRLELMHECWR